MGNQNIHVTHFTVTFALLQWSGAKPALPPRYGCKWIN